MYAIRSYYASAAGEARSRARRKPGRAHDRVGVDAVFRIELGDRARLAEALDAQRPDPVADDRAEPAQRRGIGVAHRHDRGVGRSTASEAAEPGVTAPADTSDSTAAHPPGTPLVSDPGWKLAHEALEAGVRVFPIPGASAMLAGLVASGLPSDRFLFAGFLPPKSGARQSAAEA